MQMSQGSCEHVRDWARRFAELASWLAVGPTAQQTSGIFRSCRISRDEDAVIGGFDEFVNQQGGGQVSDLARRTPTCSVSSAIKAPQGRTCQVNRDMMYPRSA
jgi:hypothetical protein